MNYTKQDWIIAGNGDGDGINFDKVNQDFSEMGKTHVDFQDDDGWFTFCRKVYFALTGNYLGDSPFRGRGSSSRWYGEQIAKVWP